jgi:hypothetical protein
LLGPSLGDEGHPLPPADGADRYHVGPVRHAQMSPNRCLAR